MRRGIGAGPALLLIALLGGLLVACSREHDASPAPAAEPAGLTVLTHGASPRVPLRIGLTAGDVTTLQVRLALSIVQTGGTTDVPVAIPTVTEQLRFRVAAVDATGADVAFEITAAELDRDGTDLSDVEFVRLTAAVQQVVGTTGTARVPGSGANSSVQLELPAGVDASLRASIDDLGDQVGRLVPPLPRAPLGVGARWRVVDTVTSGPTTVERTTTYRLVGRSGPTLRYTATVEQEARRAATDPTVAGRLVSSSATGTVSGRLSLRDLATTSSTRLTGRQQVRTGTGSTARTATQTLTMSVDVTPVG